MRPLPSSCPASPSTRLALALALTAGLAVTLHARGASARPSSNPLGNMFELHGGTFGPEVDANVPGAGTPWADTFGSKRMTLLRGHFDYQLWNGFGSLAIGMGAGYGWIDGQAVDAEGASTEDEVGFNLAPLSLSAVYRFDWAAVRHGFPLVPYARAGLTAAFWWATDAKDNIAVATDADGTSRRGGGVTFGWHAAGGLMFLLDVLAPGMAASMLDEADVRNSYLFAELSRSVLDDFGAGRALVLSDDALSFGLAFEF